MRISQDLRDAAQAQAQANSAAEIEAGMEEKAREFRESGGEVYLPVRP